MVFGDLVENTVGTYSLRAAASGLASIISNTFTISVGTPSTLIYLSQPNSTTAGTVLNPVTLKVTDSFGNLIGSTAVSMALSPGTLSGGTTTLDHRRQRARSSSAIWSKTRPAPIRCWPPRPR